MCILVAYCVCAKVLFLCHFCVHEHQCFVLKCMCLYVYAYSCVCVCIVLCSLSSLEDVTCVGKDSVKGGKLGGGQHSH